MTRGPRLRVALRAGILLIDMVSYELTVILPGELTAAKKKQIVSKIEKLIKTLKGKVGKLDDWGKINMAYEIKDSESGQYILFPIELEQVRIKELNARLKMEEDLLRYLFVKPDKAEGKK